MVKVTASEKDYNSAKCWHDFAPFDGVYDNGGLSCHCISLLHYYRYNVLKLHCLINTGSQSKSSYQPMPWSFSTVWVIRGVCHFSVSSPTCPQLACVLAEYSTTTDSGWRLSLESQLIITQSHSCHHTVTRGGGLDSHVRVPLRPCPRNMPPPHTCVARVITSGNYD